jgi:hypothetical protein
MLKMDEFFIPETLVATIFIPADAGAAGDGGRVLRITGDSDVFG